MATNHVGGPEYYVRLFKARGLDWCREAAEERRAEALSHDDPDKRFACGKIVEYLELAIEELEFERFGGMAAAQSLIDRVNGTAAAQSLIDRVRRHRP